MAGSEFRFDPSLNPPRALDPCEVFFELQASITLAQAVAERMQSEVGSLLMHLPPNAWSPLLRASHQALNEHPAAAWPGTVDLPTKPVMRVPITWRFQGMEGPSAAKVASLRVGAIVSFPDREATLKALASLATALAVRPVPAWPATVTVPGSAAPVAIEAHPLRAIDALEQVDLSSRDDPEDESYMMARQRHEYDGIPTLIEMWGSGGYVGRTWVMLIDDVVSRRGEVEPMALGELVMEHMTPGRRPYVRLRDRYVLINEL
jgi:hypothetical protein